MLGIQWQDGIEMFYNTYLTKEILEELPNISQDLSLTDGQFKDLKYEGFLIIECYQNNLNYHCGGKTNLLSSMDLKKIKCFDKNDNKYLEDYYRIDFDKYIYIFQYSEFKNGYVLLGNLLEKSMLNRLDLALLFQNYIKKDLKYGAI